MLHYGIVMLTWPGLVPDSSAYSCCSPQQCFAAPQRIISESSTVSCTASAHCMSTSAVPVR